jgi:hypothetical protein
MDSDFVCLTFSYNKNNHLDNVLILFRMLEEPFPIFLGAEIWWIEKVIGRHAFDEDILAALLRKNMSVRL